MYKKTCRWIGVKNFKSLSLKKRLSFPVLNAPKDHLLRYLRGFRHLSDLGRLKSVLRSSFAFLTDPKIWSKTCIPPPKLKILNLTFLEILTFDNLHLAKGHKRHVGYLEVSQTRSISFPGLISIWCDCFARRSRQRQKSIILPLTRLRDVISDVTDKIFQHIGKVQARN